MRKPNGLVYALLPLLLLLSLPSGAQAEFQFPPIGDPSPSKGSGTSIKPLPLEPIDFSFCTDFNIPKNSRQCSQLVRDGVHEDCDIFFIWQFDRAWNMYCSTPPYCTNRNIPSDESDCDEDMKSQILANCWTDFRNRYQGGWNRYCLPCPYVPNPVAFEDCTVKALDTAESKCTRKEFLRFSKACDEAVSAHLDTPEMRDRVDAQCHSRTNSIHASPAFADHMKNGTGAQGYYCFDNTDGDSGCLFDEQVELIKEPWNEVEYCEIPYDFTSDYHTGALTHVYTRANKLRAYSAGIKTATDVDDQSQSQYHVMKSPRSSEPMLFKDADDAVQEQYSKITSFYDDLEFLDEVQGNKPQLSSVLRGVTSPVSQITSGIEALADTRIDWEVNGSRVESCDEYVYERFYAYSKFRDFSEVLGTDYRAIFDLAYGNLPGIDPEGQAQIAYYNLSRRKAPDGENSLDVWNEDPDNWVGSDTLNTEPQPKNVFHSIDVVSNPTLTRCYEESNGRDELAACFESELSGFDWLSPLSVTLLDPQLAEKIDGAINAHGPQVRDWQWHEEMSEDLQAEGYSDDQLYVYDMIKDEFSGLIAKKQGLLESYALSVQGDIESTDEELIDAFIELFYLNLSIEKVLKSADAAGCFDDVSPNPCDWSPRSFVDSVNTGISDLMEEKLNLCLNTTGGKAFHDIADHTPIACGKTVTYLRRGDVNQAACEATCHKVSECDWSDDAYLCNACDNPSFWRDDAYVACVEQATCEELNAGKCKNTSWMHFTEDTYLFEAFMEEHEAACKEAQVALYSRAVALKESSDSQNATSESFGNSVLGIKYAYDYHYGIENFWKHLSGYVLNDDKDGVAFEDWMYAYANGSFDVSGTVFGNDLSMFHVAGDARAPGDQLDNEGKHQDKDGFDWLDTSIEITLFDRNIFTYQDNYTAPPQEGGSGDGQAGEGGSTQGDSASKPPRHLWHQTLPGKSYQQRFMVGWVPINLEAGLIGDAGVAWKPTVDFTRPDDLFAGGTISMSAGAEIKPYITARVYASAAIDAVVVAAGVLADVVLIDVALPFQASLELSLREKLDLSKKTFSLSDVQLNVNSNLKATIEALSGRLWLFASVDLGFWDKTWTKKLVDWDGLRWEVPIYNLSIHMRDSVDLKEVDAQRAGDFDEADFYHFIGKKPPAPAADPEPECNTNSDCPGRCNICLVNSCFRDERCLSDGFDLK